MQWSVFNVLFLFIVPPFILLSDHQYMRRMNLDGSGYTLFLSFNYIHGLDFDYRLVM